MTGVIVSRLGSRRRVGTTDVVYKDQEAYGNKGYL